MVSKIKYRYTAALLCVLAIISFFTLTVSATGETVSVTGVSGVTVGVNSNGTATESNGTVTVTTTGSFTSAKTATVTVTNTSGSTATISFDYSASNVSACSLGNVSSNKCSGTKSELLTSGSSITFTIKTRTYNAIAGYTATIVLSNFKVEAAAASSEVTIQFDSGSVTVDGTSVEKNEVVDISSSGATIAATSANFVGWVDTSNNKILSTSASFTLIPTEAMTIKAIHGPTARFFVEKYAEGGYLFETLPEAITYAATSTKIVVLANNGTLPALTTDDDPNTSSIDESAYTIPSGVTLLIPYDDANTLCTEKPTVTESYVPPTVYRTLTMASGAKITVNGTISVAGQVSAQYDYNGLPAGPLGFIKMDSGSSIAVNSGAKLFAYGYIYGSGSVTVNSGGTVYESFQLPDFRGGDATSTMTSDTNAETYGVFPFTQYYIQNIEVPMTLCAGATEKAIMAVNVTMAGIQTAEVPFVGASNSIFNLTTGYMVKDYRENTGRIDLKIYGNAEVSAVSISIKVSIWGTVSINSQHYEFPISNHYSIFLESGVLTVNQDIAFLPGSECYVRDGATCVLGSGVNFIVYDLDQWIYSEGKGYAGRDCEQYDPAKYAPGGLGTEGRLKDALIQVDGILDASAGYLYVTENGANICSEDSGTVKLNEGTQETIYQVLQYKGVSADADDGEISYTEIKIVPAILQNSDDSCVQSGTNTYTYVDGYWRCGTHTFSNGICSVCGIHMFTIESSQIYLGNNLNMGFRFVYNGAATDGLSGYTVKLTHTDAENKTVAEVTYSLGNQDYPWYTGSDDNGTFYYVVYDGLAARRMCDTITLAVYSGDTQVSESYEDSMQDYAMRMLEGTTDADANKRTVLVDMLNYGAAAQVHFEYNYESANLANALLSPEQQAYATDSLKNTSVPESNLNFEGSNWLKSNLVSISNIQFLMAIEGLNPNSTVTVTFTNHRGDSKEITSPIIGQAGDYYYVTIDKLVVADAWCPVTVTVDGVEYTDSIVGYLDRYEGDSAVYDAYWKFADSAYAYFHPDN